MTESYEDLAARLNGEDPEATQGIQLVDDLQAAAAAIRALLAERADLWEEGYWARSWNFSEGHNPYRDRSDT